MHIRVTTSREELRIRTLIRMYGQWVRAPIAFIHRVANFAASVQLS